MIEVLVALAVLSLLSLLIWQEMKIVTLSKDRFEKKGEAFRGASLTLQRLSADLQMAVLFSSPDILGVSSGGEQVTKSVFVGKNSGDQDGIVFNSLSHIRYLKDSKESDLAEVGYFLEPAQEEGEGPFLLKKRDSSPPDAEPEEGGRTFTLLTGVKELNFRYYDLQKQEFVDQWDSTSLDYVNRLPRAVEIALVVRNPVSEEEEFRFATVVLLEMAPGPNDF